MHKFEECDLEMYMHRFVNRGDVWYQQQSDGKYFAQKPGNALYEPVSTGLVSKVLAGELSCALPALDENGLCKWAAWDWDKDTDVLNNIEHAVRDLNFNPLREGRRDGRSGHCWLFFSEPIPATDLIIFDKWLREQLLIHEHALEFFPKQSSATAGNGLRLPLGINLKPEANQARGWFDGVEQDVEVQLKWFLNQPLTDARSVKLIVSEARKREPLEFPIIRSGIKRGAANFNIEDYISLQTCQTIGGEHVTQCPVCADEGHDKSRDNLHILDEGNFLCMFGQPGKTHSKPQIIERLRNHR